MSGLLGDLCDRIGASARLPAPPADRLLAVEHAATRLMNYTRGASEDAEPWSSFVARLALDELGEIRPKDYRRLIDQIWADDDLRGDCVPVLDFAVSEGRASYDRTTIFAYLRHFPLKHPHFEHLAAAASLAAQRRDKWPWKERGTRWALWNKDVGPAKVAKALIGSDDASSILRDAGLDQQLADGRFLEAVLEKACVAALGQSGRNAERTGQRLIQLVESLPAIGELDGMLAYALLAPWSSESPAESHRRIIIKFLVDRIGDPRLRQAKWAALITDIQARIPGADPVTAFTILRRWLIQTTVREFFKIVGRTTNDPVQWAAREKFWTAYLDAELINDAWFAFGDEARQKARAFTSDNSVGFGLVNRPGVDPSHSTLIMSLGDARIAEWSHNGSCRFWTANDRRAPALYKNSYFGDDLRAMSGGAGFMRIPHQGGWQQKFAGQIYRTTGIRHPQYSRGS